MVNNRADTNGWPEYKKTVIQQLEYLTQEVKEVREAVNQVDKDLQVMVTRDKLDAELTALQIKRETDLSTLTTKRDLDITIFNKKRDETSVAITQQISLVLNEIKRLDVEWAAHKGEEEKGRKVWAIIITCITITINIAGLITALILIK